jgi:hypothetical protein
MSHAEIDPKLLRPNPWNTNVVSPSGEAKLDASVRRLGMFKAVLVRELPGGELQILGGAHRVQSAIRLGLKKIPIWNLGPIDDAKAKEIGLVDNGRYGADDAIALAELLEGMGDLRELSTFMPYSDAELTAIFSSSSIDLDEIGDEDTGPPEPPPARAPKTHTMMRFKVPVEDAERIGDLFEKIMKRQGFTEADALTNAGDALVWVVSEFERAA